MKKLIVLCALSFMFAFSASATITITKTGGGPDGYYNVDETHGGGDHTLTCKNPGKCGCQWDNAPSEVIISNPQQIFNIDQDIIPVVESQISRNVLQGQYFLAPDVTVSWGGTDIYNYQMQISGNFTTDY
jgi:hypothetical protein